MFRYVNHPVARMIVALVLIAAAGVEVVRELLAEERMLFGAHHGIALYGVFQLLTATAALVDNLGAGAEQVAPIE